MPRALGPFLKTLLFAILVPGFLIVGAPYLLLGGFPPVRPGLVSWLGILCIAIGIAIYVSCAWQFAERGLGTPASIAPTKNLVVTGLHRYLRNPMYVGVWFVLLGEAALFRVALLRVYAAFFCMAVYLFVRFYEEPTLHRQFGASYDEYRHRVPGWIPRLRKQG